MSCSVIYKVKTLKILKHENSLSEKCITCWIIADKDHFFVLQEDK